MQEETGDLPSSIGSKYHFREKPRLTSTGVSPWLDQDKSGTYDPSQKKVVVPQKRQRQALVEHEQATEGTPKKAKGLSYKQGRRVGQSSMVVFKLSSEKAKTLLEDVQPLSNVDADATNSEFLETDLSNLQHPTRRRSKAVQNLLFEAATPKESSHARGCKACLEIGIPCSLLEEGSTYPCASCVEDECECELILPPSKKEACEACCKARVRCSYKDGGDHSLTCERCQVHGSLCVVRSDNAESSSSGSSKVHTRFVPTAERPFLSCYPCRKAKKKCPLTSSTGPPCKSCAINGFACTFEAINRDDKRLRTANEEAAETLLARETFYSTEKASESERGNSLPLKDLKETPALNQRTDHLSASQRTVHVSPTIEPSQNQLWKEGEGNGTSLSSVTLEGLSPQATGSAEALTQSSFNHLPDEDTRSAIPMLGHSNYVYPAPQTPAPAHAASSEQPVTPTTSSAPQEAPPVRPESPDDDTGLVQTLLTRFAHPIEFNHQPPDDGSRPCHWCARQAFGLMGLPVVSVQVVSWTNNGVYHELSGGHRAQGTDATRMCMNCVSERFCIITCMTHRIVPIAGLNEANFDFHGAYDRLNFNGPESFGTRWCSVCPSPAFYRCCVFQRTNIFGAVNSPADLAAYGCGLVLCSSCAGSVRDDYAGSAHNYLTHMWPAIHIPSQEFPLGLRADAGLLTFWGELTQRFAPTEHLSPELQRAIFSMRIG